MGETLKFIGTRNARKEYKMLEYKSKYFTKSLSVFGEPKISTIKQLQKFIELDKNSKILIPNCQDGIYVLPFAKISNNIVCYEENEILLNGGIIDDFYSLGLTNRLKGANLRKNVKIKKCNYYDVNNSNKYDLVVAIRTLQLKENDKYNIDEKINKLMSNVREGGYLYLVYYIDEDIEVSHNQIIRYNQIKKNIDLDKWNILYYRDNFQRYTTHCSHPYNKGVHQHKVGFMLLKKTAYVYKKRIINRKYKSSSIYGEPNQQIYDYINFLKKRYDRNIDILIVDANDGKNVLPFAKCGFNIVCYEENKILLNGGVYNNLKTAGLKKRISDYLISDNVLIKQFNYYETKEIKKFDFLYVDSSLSLEKNNKISLKKKVRKLMSNVREGGYLYIYYDLVLDESEEYNNSYFHLGEMQKIFDLEDWKIEYICERNAINYCNYIYNSNRKVGYILANKKRNRRVHKCHYSIEINNKIEF